MNQGVTLKIRKTEKDTNPYVESAWPNALRNSHSIDDCTDDVEYGHQRQPAESRIVNCRPEAISDDAMHGWDDATQTETNKYTYENK